MTEAHHRREAEIALGVKSRDQAEAERKNVTADRLAVTVTEFIERRAFSYWLRLIVENIGVLPDAVAAMLQERCPGFLEYAAAYARQHPGEQELLWLRFWEWTDEKLFEAAIAEGWRHVLGYDAMRDPRMGQIRTYWKGCRETWKSQSPQSLPDFESWRASALQIR
jgi:hypothetical protein